MDELGDLSHPLLPPALLPRVLGGRRLVHHQHQGWHGGGGEGGGHQEDDAGAQALALRPCPEEVFCRALQGWNVCEDGAAQALGHGLDLVPDQGKGVGPSAAAAGGRRHGCGRGRGGGCSLLLRLLLLLSLLLLCQTELHHAAALLLLKMRLLLLLLLLLLSAPGQRRRLPCATLLYGRSSAGQAAQARPAAALCVDSCCS